jgi:hypothetical protein
MAVGLSLSLSLVSGPRCWLWLQQQPQQTADTVETEVGVGVKSAPLTSAFALVLKVFVLPVCGRNPIMEWKDTCLGLGLGSCKKREEFLSYLFFLLWLPITNKLYKILIPTSLCDLQFYSPRPRPSSPPQSLPIVLVIFHISLEQ